MRETLFQPASFGENVLLDRWLPGELCVGDVLSVLREGAEVCACQITSPRWPCYKVDKRHSKPLAAAKPEERVRGLCCATGLGGFFAKVILPGSIAPGDTIAVTKRPQPQWPVERVSRVFYGGGNRRTAMMDVWNGTEEELQECLQMTELAEFEWRDRLKQYVAKREAQRLRRREQWTRGLLAGAAVLVALIAVFFGLNMRVN